MTVAEALRAGVDSHYDAFGQDCTHTDVDGANTRVTAIVTHDLTPYGPDVASVTVGTVAISVRKTDIETPPRKGETYRVGVNTYYVDSIVAENELEYTALAS